MSGKWSDLKQHADKTVPTSMSDPVTIIPVRLLIKSPTTPNSNMPMMDPTEVMDPRSAIVVEFSPKPLASSASISLKTDNTTSITKTAYDRANAPADRWDTKI